MWRMTRTARRVLAGSDIAAAVGWRRAGRAGGYKRTRWNVVLGAAKEAGRKLANASMRPDLRSRDECAQVTGCVIRLPALLLVSFIAIRTRTSKFAVMKQENLKPETSVGRRKAPSPELAWPVKGRGVEAVVL